MKKGSLVQLKANRAFSVEQLIKAYELGILLPRHGEVYTLAADPEEDPCTCGRPNCENGWVILLEEIPTHKFSPVFFDEVQTPNTVNINELLDPSQTH